MSTFGIIAPNCWSSDSYYVGQDEVLWEWLQSDDYQHSDHESRYVVQAPSGYVFLDGSLHPLDSKVVKDANPEKLKGIASVTVGSPYNDKVLRTLAALQYLNRREFNVCDIPEDRIIEILIY